MQTVGPGDHPRIVQPEHPAALLGAAEQDVPVRRERAAVELVDQVEHAVAEPYPLPSASKRYTDELKVNARPAVGPSSKDIAATTAPSGIETS